jgi:hypothetical protein
MRLEEAVTPLGWHSMLVSCAFTILMGLEEAVTMFDWQTDSTGRIYRTGEQHPLFMGKTVSIYLVSCPVCGRLCHLVDGEIEEHIEMGGSLGIFSTCMCGGSFRRVE